jgi:hypothetical protein
MTQEELSELLKNCSGEEFISILKILLYRLGYSNDIRLFASGEGISGWFIDDTSELVIVLAKQYDLLAVSYEELILFENEIFTKHAKKGIFITTSMFSREAQDYAISKQGLSLINESIMCKYLFGTKLGLGSNLKCSPSIESTEVFRERNSKKHLCVTFPDGTVYCDKSPTQTQIMTISRIGIEKVASLGLEVCHIPLVGRKIYPKYEQWQKPITDGWYLMTQTDTGQKHRQLLSISNQLKLNLKIEASNNIFIKSNVEGKIVRHKDNSKILVELADGNIIANDNQTQTFKEAVEQLDMRRLSLSDILVAGKPLLTVVKKFNNQEQLINGQWITIPNGNKNKFKMLKLLSIYAKQKMTISLI